MDGLNYEIMQMINEHRVLRSKQAENAQKLGDKDKYGFPFEPDDAISTNKLGFLETAMRLQTEANETFRFLRNINRHSPLFYKMSSELEKLVPTLHMNSVYTLLSEFPGAKYVAEAHMTRLKHLLAKSSKGRYDRDFAETVRNAARNSIGSDMPAKSLELKHTIALIHVLTDEIDEVEASIREIMDTIDAPILGIPGINYRMGAMILAELGDLSRFSSPDKILAYAGMSPSTYQSGQLTSSYAHMEKRGSRYLRYALFNATQYVCIWDPTYKAYLEKKRSEGKHYFVAISHAAKKLVRLIYHLQTTGEAYCPMA